MPKGSEMLSIRNKKKTEKMPDMGATAPARVGDREIFKLCPFPTENERELYSELREQVPIIDACIGKIIRLAGGFKVEANDQRYQSQLDWFFENVKIGASGRSLDTFFDCYLDSLLTYGCSLAEIVYDRTKCGIAGIYVAPVKFLDIKEGKKPFTRDYYVGKGRNAVRIKHRENLVFTALSPTSENPMGTSVLRGLPALSRILLRVYESIGQNFDRVGSVRYAVTYKPSSDSDKAFAREHAMQIANEWSNGMQAAKNGEIRDFVAVGDVDIKVIGADNQILDTEIPVRQLLEQLVAKLGIPPFLLGLSWSSTERMSVQQCDILTSELEYYRRLIEPAVKKICDTYLRLIGSADGVSVTWDDIDLMDIEALSQARLNNANAEAIEYENEQRRLSA